MLNRRWPTVMIALIIAYLKFDSGRSRFQPGESHSKAFSVFVKSSGTFGQPSFQALVLIHQNNAECDGRRLDTTNADNLPRDEEVGGAAPAPAPPMRGDAVMMGTRRGRRRSVYTNPHK